MLSHPRLRLNKRLLDKHLVARRLVVKAHRRPIQRCPELSRQDPINQGLPLRPLQQPLRQLPLRQRLLLPFRPPPTLLRRQRGRPYCPLTTCPSRPSPSEVSIARNSIH